MMIRYFTSIGNMRAWFFNTVLQFYVVASHAYWWVSDGTFVWYQMLASLVLFILGALIVQNRIQTRLWITVWPGTAIQFYGMSGLEEKETREWLDDAVGKWNYLCAEREGLIYFRRSQDAVAFRLAFV